MPYDVNLAAQDANKWTWMNFKPDECRKNRWDQQTGVGLLKANFMDKLQVMRTSIGQPFVITSAFRGPEYNQLVGGKKESKHLLGHAVDIQCNGELAAMIAHFVLHNNMFNGLGVYQSGDWKSRFLHVDDAHGGHGYPVIWSS